MSDLQKTLLNPTARDVMLTSIIDQSRGERANKKEAKWKQCFMTGNIKSYSRILNDQKGPEKIKNYNNMAVGLEMMNADKDAKTKDSAANRVEEAARTAQIKEEKEADESNKQNELLAGF